MFQKVQFIDLISSFLQKRLNVGDVVKCCIKKITYFGVFVEVNRVFYSH